MRKSNTCLSCKKETSNPKYCSMACKNKGQTNCVMKSCGFCGCGFSVSLCHKKQKFCSKTCFFTSLSRNARGDRVEVKKGMREELYKKYGYLCFLCKKVEHEKMIPLQIHHIDNNPKNTVFDNLIPLCISCHQKTKVTQGDKRIFISHYLS